MRPNSQNWDQSPNLPTPVGVKEYSQALKMPRQVYTHENFKSTEHGRRWIISARIQSIHIKISDLLSQLTHGSFNAKYSE